MSDANISMVEILKSSMRLDVETRTFLICAMGGYTAAVLLVWVFTGSHVALVSFAAFALWNIREINRVNLLNERILNCDFGEVFSFSTQTIIRWSYVMATHAENRAPLLAAREVKP